MKKFLTSITLCTIMTSATIPAFASETAKADDSSLQTVSLDDNIQVIINEKSSINHRSLGIAHEFGHVLLYLKGKPFGHGQSGVDDFIYGKSNIMLKRLGYDF